MKTLVILAVSLIITIGLVSVGIDAMITTAKLDIDNTRAKQLRSIQ